ncbi:hypothetical protein QYE76_002848 [Lolium multiflorum]|uniref:CCHC-type domain-containing protein n=1 Tax=Lolium multiflorum TaxID=4521 RepID=A0AAD8W0Q1_LOLMU|nr:hypothetical protein QYE76_002848 [Lolium multiflorum]
MLTSPSRARRSSYSTTTAGSLRLQRAKKDATIRRLRARIASLEATVKAQEDQILQLEDDDGGIDIQGGDAFLSDDNDFEETRTPRRRTTSSWRQDPTTTSRSMSRMRSSCTSLTYVGMAPPNRTNDAMLQLLQTMLADRETERAERQANLIALQNIANQGHGNHDHPGSKLKNFQNTNPPVFSKTEEPLDADDWLQTMENNLETVLVNIPFADLEALVDPAIQMEGKLNQAKENRKRRMANQSGSSHPQKYRPSSSGGFTPRNNKPPMQNSRPGYQNRSGGNSKPGGYNNNNNNNNNNNYNRALPRAPNNNNNNNTAPRTGSNAVPVANKQDKTTITCYECGVVGHYSNECPKRLAKLAGNTAAPAQQERTPEREGKARHGHAGHVANPTTSTSLPSFPNLTMPQLATVLSYAALAPPRSSSTTTMAGRRAPAHALDAARVAHARHGRALATSRATTSRSPWPRSQRLEHHHDTWTPPDTRSTTTRAHRRRRRKPWSAADAADMETTRPNQALPDQAVAAIRLAWTRRASP